MNKLIFVPLPRLEESPLSMLRRAAIKNGFSNFYAFTSTTIGPWRPTLNALSQRSALADFLISEWGTPAAEIKEGFFSTRLVGKHALVRISGIEIPASLLRWTASAFCDDCFAQGWDHQIRDFKCSEYCPYHKKKYLTHCPACKKTIQWVYTFKNQCAFCQSPLECTPCSEQECSMEAELLKIIRASNQEQFDQLDSISRKLNYTNNNNPHLGTHYRTLLTAAFSVLRNDTPGILDYLRNISAEYPDVEREWIVAKIHFIETAAAKSAIEIFLADPPPLQIIRPPPKKPFILNRRELSWAVGVSTYQLYENRKKIKDHFHFCSTGFNIDEARHIKKEFAKLSVSVRDSLPMPSDQMWTSSQAQQALQVSKVALLNLSQLRLIIRYGSERSPLYSPKQIKSFLSSYTPFSKLRKELALPSSIIKGKMHDLGLHPCHNESLTCEFWTIESQNVKKITDSINPTKKMSIKPALRTLKPGNTELVNYCNVNDMTRELKIPTCAVRALIQSNLLEGVIRVKHSFRIPKSALESSKNMYITLRDAGRIFGAPDILINKILSHFGVTPYSASPSIPSHHVIYKKSEVLGALKKAMHPTTGRPITYHGATFSAQALATSLATLKKLAHAGIIESIKSKTDLIFRSDWLEQFNEKYILAGEILKLADLQPGMRRALTLTLAKHNTFPIKLQNTFRPPLTYKKDELIKSGKLDKKLKFALLKLKNIQGAIKHAKNKIQGEAFLRLSDIITKHKISQRAFYSIFLKHKNITITIFNQIRFISTTDAKVVNEVLSRFYTPTQIDKLFFADKQKTSKLIHLNKLTPEYPFPRDKMGTTLISKEQINTYINQHPHNIDKTH